MKKIIFIIIFVVVLIAIWFTIRFVIGGSEDSWICKNGKWVEHGHPNPPMPTKECK